MDIRDIHKIELLYNSKVIRKNTVDNAYRVINRTKFDNELLKYYKGVSGMQFNGQKDYKIVYDNLEFMGAMINGAAGSDRQWFWRGESCFMNGIDIIREWVIDL